MNTLNPSQQKLAEKLIILNDRAIGMLTRLYNIKRACSEPKSKPSFLKDKSLESVLKHIGRKFPNLEIKSSGGSVSAIAPIRQEVIKSLSLYYLTFVDFLDLKDAISELLTIMDACQVHLDITLNTDLTTAYLNLVVNYVCLLLLLSRVEDRKAVLGLYNVAHSLEHEQSDPAFPRLGQLILDYESPMRRLHEEFIPHSRLLLRALESLASVYLRRNLGADQWRSVQLLSIVASPQQMLYAAQTETIPCEYLSLDAMDRWILFGLALCHNHLATPAFHELWRKALEGNLRLRIFRDETLPLHQFIQSYFETVKGYNKRLTELKEFYAAAVQSAALMHRERRKFLRSALKELCLVLSDQPGLLGPKILFVFMALSFSRDEVAWLLRHSNAWPSKGQKGTRGSEEVIDRQLPELLFYMEELRGLITKYGQVIQRYYLQYLAGYDAIAIAELLQNTPGVPEDEAAILSSFANSLANLNLDALTTESAVLDFRGLRLDWCRLQAYTSVARSGFALSEHRKLAQSLNTAVFHLKCVDFLDELLVETSDLSLYCYYTKQLEEQFSLCLELPSQTRYIVAFPLLTAHWVSSLHELCPEERIHIGEKSLTFCNLFLEEMAKEAKDIITNICDQHCVLADQVLAKHCSSLIRQAVAEKAKAAKSGKPRAPLAQPMPGDESYRRHREEMSMLDKLTIVLTELAAAIQYQKEILVWNHTFCPREFLTQHLEGRFNKTIVGMVSFNPDTCAIAKPSELRHSIRTYMSVFQTVESFVDIDVARIFNNVLLQQTQPVDCHGEDTMTTLYTRWFLDVLLRRVSASSILFSPHHQAFLNNPNTDAATPFSAQEYTDLNELRCLAELLGGYGIKFLCDRLIWHVASQISEMKALVKSNREVLKLLRSSFDKPAKMRDLMRQLIATSGGEAKKLQMDVVENLIQRITICGEILAFKSLLQKSLNDVLEQRTPFLLSSVKDLKKTFPEEHPDQLAAWEVISAAGMKPEVDPSLVTSIRAQTQQGEPTNAEEDYVNCCLLMVFMAVALPRLARNPASFFKAHIGAHLNNAHCIAYAVNAVGGALFTLHGRGDLLDRMKEFLALASSSLLSRLGGDGRAEEGGADGRTAESVYILLEQIVEASPWLRLDMLESCFPYILLRASFHNCYTMEEASAAHH